MPPGKRRGKRSQASEDARFARYLAAKERAKQEGTPFVPHSRDPTQPKQKAKAKPSRRPRTPSAPSTAGSAAAPGPSPPDAAIPALEETLDPRRPATPRLPWADRFDEEGSHRRHYTLISDWGGSPSATRQAAARSLEVARDARLRTQRALGDQVLHDARALLPAASPPGDAPSADEPMGTAPDSPPADTDQTQREQHEAASREQEVTAKDHAAVQARVRSSQEFARTQALAKADAKAAAIFASVARAPTSARPSTGAPELPAASTAAVSSTTPQAPSRKGNLRPRRGYP